MLLIKQHKYQRRADREQDCRLTAPSKPIALKWITHPKLTARAPGDKTAEDLQYKGASFPIRNTTITPFTVFTSTSGARPNQLKPKRNKTNNAGLFSQPWYRNPRGKSLICIKQDKNPSGLQTGVVGRIHSISPPRASCIELAR